MDPIADMLTIIRNGYLSRRQKVSVSYSRLKKQIAEKILLLGFLESVEVDEKGRKLNISLRYEEGQPVLNGIERVAKPSLRIYSPVRKIPRVLGGRGDVIISTSKGILTGAEARKLKAGGELILKVW